MYIKYFSIFASIYTVKINVCFQTVHSRFICLYNYLNSYTNQNDDSYFLDKKPRYTKYLGIRVLNKGTDDFV